MCAKPDHINCQTREDLGGHKGRVLGVRQRLIYQNQKRGEEFMNRELKPYRKDPYPTAGAFADSCGQSQAGTEEGQKQASVSVSTLEASVASEGAAWAKALKDKVWRKQAADSTAMLLPTSLILSKCEESGTLEKA